MDRASAIEHQRLPLIGHVMALFAMIGLVEGGTVERVPKPLHRSVLRILRTMESAVRRLIVAAARDIVLEPPKPRPPRTTAKPRDKAKARADGEVKEKRKRRPLFNLFDPLRRLGRRFRKKKRRGPEPRAYFFPPDPPDTRHPIFRGLRQPVPEPPPPPPPPPPAPVVEKKADDGTVNAKPLIRRLMAVLDAVQDIPRQALRLARWQARPKEERRPERWSPLRPGRPPGFRRRPIHEVDDILKECHWLATDGNPPLDDTS
ncbi:MAG: hypothetical protein JNM20_07985 [Rhizobiales bacterium]|nr:hypothetical protein [Hyphomicrobiales bacterium]